MMPDPELIAAVVAGVAGCLAGCAATIFCVLTLRRYRSDSALQVIHLREESEARQVVCLAEIAALKVDFNSLELSIQSTEEVLRDGRLNRTSRAQAMQILRTGVSPDTAASTLGVAKREMRLLARVSGLISRVTAAR